MAGDALAPQVPVAAEEMHEEAPKPRRRRTTRKKAETSAEGDTPQPQDGEAPAAEEAPKPRRRRASRKKAQEGEAPASAAADNAQAEAPEPAPAAEEAPKRTRRRRTKKSDDAAEHADEHASENAGETSGQTGAAPASEAADAQGDSHKEEAPAPQAEAAEAPEAGPRHEEHDGNADAAEGQDEREEHVRGRRGRNGRRFEHRDEHNGGNEHSNGGRYNGGQMGQRNDRYGNQRNGRNGNRRRSNRRQQEVIEPSLTRDELKEMKVAELRSKAAELGVEYVGARKADLVDRIYEAAAKAEGFRPVDGILEIQPEGYGFIRTGNYMQGDDDAFVFQQMIKQNGLRTGDQIVGTVGPNRSNSKFPPLISIDTVDGMTVEELRHRPRFRDLTPIYPNECLKMEHGKDSITGRAIDIVSPIGKGQRGLIVSPPKAGKTTVLKKVCESIAANNPEVHLICLLVDERPEEVTDMQRSIRGEVVASTFDMPASNHTAVSELVIERAKRLVELGEDVVVVLDSITRLARAYNLAMPASGRILSGGVDSAALYPPKKFLGAARNIENGGSLTILASALVDTGSKMDEVIFEEFKGTGNMELKLDRDLADKRIFPAIDPVASGTRNEELLIDPEMQPFVWGIRRILANMNNVERAETALVKSLKATSSNEEFLIRSAKKAAQSEYLDAI